ncbi:MAG: serine/threonine protein kinase [Phycisphaerales bacterium]|nr:serine/threonine protein kinase [Phycisphaerales bacterium]
MPIRQSNFASKSKDDEKTFIIESPNGSRYLLGTALDCGAFGCVYDGLDIQANPVAIKVIGTKTSDMDGLKTCVNEVTNLANCNHPNIVRVFDAFLYDEHAVIVMEKALCSLRSQLQAGVSFSPLAVCSIAIQCLRALQHIHGKLVVHRDIKPSNILVFPENRVKVADFGISKGAVPIDGFAKTFIGYTPFIPPELILESRSTHRSDLYQLGLVLLQLVSGNEPIDSSLPPQVIRQHILAGSARQRAERLADLPGSKGQIAHAISICLRRRVEYRFKDAAAALAEFSQIMLNMLAPIPAQPSF